MKAYEVIEKYGWVQNTYGCKSLGFCAVGAIDFCGSPDRNEAFNAVYQHLGTSFSSITDWNDKPGRTKKEVLNLLRHLNV